MSPRLGRTGLWSTWDRLGASELLDVARSAERLGYDAFWSQEGVGREPFALLGRVAAETERITLAVGIAQTSARDPLAAHAAAATLQELCGGRFVLGLGVGHQEIETVRGHAWRPPLQAMREYLDAFRVATYRGPLPYGEPPVVLAALRQGMLRLAAELADGAFAYCVPVGYVASARRHLDEAATRSGRPRPTLVVSAAVRLEADPQAARRAARGYLDRYLGLPNYLANLRELGYTDADLARPGSDRVVDALVAWGDDVALRARLRAYADAGADHVAMIPLTAEGAMADVPTIERLAPPW